MPPGQALGDPLKPHSPKLIARIKGALQAGIPSKTVARLSGLPVDTVRNIQSEKRHAAVQPDMALVDALRRAMLSE